MRNERGACILVQMSLPHRTQASSRGLPNACGLTRSEKFRQSNEETHRGDANNAWFIVKSECADCKASVETSAITYRVLVKLQLQSVPAVGKDSSYGMAIHRLWRMRSNSYEPRALNCRFPTSTRHPKSEPVFHDPETSCMPSRANATDWMSLI